MSRSAKDLFKWRQYKGKLILLCVRWYLAFTLSYRQLERMLREQGWSVDHTSVFRWVQRYGLAITHPVFCSRETQYRSPGLVVFMRGRHEDHE